jgi:hypothetical protein
MNKMMKTWHETKKSRDSGTRQRHQARRDITQNIKQNQKIINKN